MGLFGKEKITLTLEKYDYVPGEKIKGTVKLNLKKPTQARELNVAFIGKKIQRQKGGNSPSNSSQIIHSFDMPLAGEQEYQNEEYPFEIKIQSDLLKNTPQLEGNLGGVVKAMKFLSSMSIRIDWYVKAQLDVPMKLDIKKSQKIVLSSE